MLLSPLEQSRSSLPSLTVSSIFGVIALQKASILFGLEEELVKRPERALAASFTGKKQGTGESSRIMWKAMRTVILLAGVSASLL
jgi:hypothetical protein